MVVEGVGIQESGGPEVAVVEGKGRLGVVAGRLRGQEQQWPRLGECR